jgi:hypothetical protein
MIRSKNRSARRLLQRKLFVTESAQQSTLANRKGRKIKKLATLKKPPNCLTKASAKLQLLLRRLQPRSVVLWRLVVVLLLQVLLRQPAPTPPAAAAPLLRIINTLPYTVVHIITSLHQKISQ